MARARTPGNGRVDRLADALTSMLHGQALLQQQLGALASRQADTDSRIADYERRIDATLLDHSRILQDHSRMLQELSHILEEHGHILAALPDAVRERMGFKPS